MSLFPNKEPTPNFSDPAARKEFVDQTQNDRELCQKEISVNQAEQVLLSQRIKIMKSFINDIPSSDPQYSMLLYQVEMDEIELSELRIRAALITQRLHENK